MSIHIILIIINISLLYAFIPMPTYINKIKYLQSNHDKKDFDFYIYKILEIEKLNNLSSFIELSCKKGYYVDYCNFDNDNIGYIDDIKEHYTSQLCPLHHPITIYENHKSYLKDLYELNYHDIIDTFIIENNINWNHITNIKIIEIRSKIY